MEKQDIITSIQANEAALRRLGVRSLALFGSFARDDAADDSDVDLLYAFEEGAATLDHYLELRALLERLFGRPVELVPHKHLSPILRRYIADDIEAILVPSG